MDDSILEILRQKALAAERAGNQMGAPIQNAAQQMGKQLESSLPGSSGQGMAMPQAPQAPPDMQAMPSRQPTQGMPTAADRAAQLAAVAAMNQRIKQRDAAETAANQPQDAREAADLARQNQPQSPTDNEDMSGYQDYPRKFNKLRGKLK